MMVSVADSDRIATSPWHLIDGDKILVTVAHHDGGRPVELLLSKAAACVMCALLAEATS